MAAKDSHIWERVWKARDRAGSKGQNVIVRLCLVSGRTKMYELIRRSCEAKCRQKM